MSCNHDNPPHYRFCGTCGERLERRSCPFCGACLQSHDQFCGQCGQCLEHDSASALLSDSEQENLLQLLHEAEGDSQYLTSSRARVTQDDIRKLLEKRRKNR